MEQRMTVLIRLIVLSGLLVVLAAPGPVNAAGPFDGTRPFFCAISTIMECDATGQCERHVSNRQNQITFVRVDVAGQVVSASGGRKSPLKTVQHVDGELILQGGENGRGWSATVDEDSGRMAAAVVDNDHIFSLFGSCTLP